MLQVQQCCIFDAPADVYVNTVNCVGVMGKGLAKEFKALYPAMYKEYRQKCLDGSLRPGDYHAYVTETYGVNAPHLTILNIPTKDDWRNRSTLEYVRLGVEAISRYLDERTGLEVRVPLLGCSNGGLNKTDVIPILQTIRHDRHSVTICDF